MQVSFSKECSSVLTTEPKFLLNKVPRSKVSLEQIRAVKSMTSLKNKLSPLLDGKKQKIILYLPPESATFNT